MVAIWAYLNPQRIQNPFDFRGLLTPGLVIGVVLGLIFLEPDYATTLICGSIAMATFFIAGASIRWVTFALVLLIGVVGFTVTQKVGERSARINAWKNIWTSESQTLRDENRQQLASVKAIASGQLLGKGLGLGSAKLGSLSEHDSDFIFAVVAEEFGFVGSLSMLLGFVFILYAGTSISINSKDLFGRVLAMGIVTMISVQVVLNLATTTALVPNTGLTLPFFSKGGSSLIIMLVSMGLLMGVERETRAPLKPSTTDLLPENSRASDNPFAS
jgi:cell division protein FtsW